jgi:N-acetyl-gamma-glutamyl-phosphate reductase
VKRLLGQLTSIKEQIISAWKATYAQQPFVWVFTEGIPQLAHVVNTNRCALGVEVTHQKIVIVSVIDNLLKGASGQAVQNFNRMIAVQETCGLEHLQ